MTDYHNQVTNIITLVAAANLATSDREQMRYIMNEIHRISGHVCLLIDQEVIRELKDLRRADPNHGFTGSTGTTPKVFTADDLL